MRESTHLLPQAERLLRRIAGLEAPLIELWGWPGSGAAALLQALLPLPGSRGLALAELAEEAAVRLALAPADSRMLVVAGDPGQRLADLASWLRPGQQLAFTASRSHAGLTLPVALIPPQELLLTVAELAQLWYLANGRQPRDSAAQALWRATDGWFRPVWLALEATGGVGLDNATAEQLLEIAPLRLFLRHELLDPLPAADREALLLAPRHRPPAVGGAEAPGWAVADGLGLWVEDGDHDRLPALLFAYLERDKRRRRLAARADAGRPPEPPPGAVEPPAAGSRKLPRATKATEAAAASPARLRPLFRVSLFGNPRVVAVEQADRLATTSEREVSWKLRRSFQVLAFLASSPGLQAGREDLEEAIWPADGERTIDRNFHPTLSHLRRSLERGERGVMPPPLLFRGGVYRLNPEIEWDVDLQDFDRRLAQGRELAASGQHGAAESWRRAWGPPPGPFLHGHYEHWAVARREQYQETYVELLRELGDLSVRLEELEGALDAYRAVLLEDPLQERTHLAVMRLYAGQGRRDLVRRQYERLCTVLLDELGVEPLPETEQEYHRLMS
jgi:DNA-binding SARP family transcriptional activator